MVPDGSEEGELFDLGLGNTADGQMTLGDFLMYISFTFLLAMPVIELTTTGAKSGKQHTTPLTYQPDGDKIYIFGSFAGLPHRMVLVRELDGVRWINDSKGTNVDATLKSLESFPASSVPLTVTCWPIGSMQCSRSSAAPRPSNSM